MLITQLKLKDSIMSLAKGKTVIISCEGCKEVYFPTSETAELRKEIAENGNVTVNVVTDYICNPDNLELQLERHIDKVQDADTVLVFSCGVGVQTVAAMFEDKRVYPGCDTCQLPGFQGVTPLEHDCDQCGECYLNYTGGICPITACSKSLINGQCGGSKNGMCEVDSDMECGWERIYRKLEKLGKLEVLTAPAKVRNFATDTMPPKSEW